jgi:hypothetical protein
MSFGDMAFAVERAKGSFGFLVVGFVFRPHENFLPS